MRTCKYCKYCKETFDTDNKPIGWIGNHTRWCHKNPNRNKSKRARKTKVCPGCEIKFIGRNKYCSLECKNKNFKLSEEAKKKISDARKNFLLNNPEEHPWKKSDKFVSPPCEFFKSYLDSKNIKYLEEYRPLTDRFFSIDIAFPDLKIGIEINGEQHYNRDGSLTEYYQNRHEKITSVGRELFEIHYRHAFYPEDVMSKIEIGEQPDYTEYFEEKRKQKKKVLTKKEIGDKVREETDKKNIPLIPIVKNSNIDFSKYGWTSKVAKLLSIKPQKVNKWMKRYMNEFYEEKCFKRKRNNRLS